MSTLPSTMSTHATLEYTDATQAQTAAHDLRGQSLVVVHRQSRIVEEAPPLPYTTLDLLEEAALRLDWSSRKTMIEAQSLFEAGHITYPRTDSIHVAPEAVEAARQVVVRLFGPEALNPPKSEHRQFVPAWLGKRPKEPVEEANENSEAHEAIRPTDPACLPDDLRDLEKDSLALYRLTWQRFVASQMRPARYQIVEVTFRKSP